VIKIVTDSGSGISPEIAQQYGITVVPLYVHFGTETFRDGVDIHLADFLSRLKSSPQLPTTSQPSAGDFLEVYKPLIADGSEVVSIHLSAKLSGTVASANTAREMLPDASIHVVDSLFISAPQAFMAIEAARMAAAGQSAEAILARLKKLIAGFHIYFVVDTLEYLQKGGRIGKAAALLGTALQMKPILALEEGIVDAKERIRTKNRAVVRIQELAVQETAGRSCRYLGILHAAAPDEACQLEAHLVSRLAPAETIMSEVGPVIATHTGPGVVGAAFYAE
jgi:fatty acid kinase fatty acid binding subunit